MKTKLFGVLIATFVLSVVVIVPAMAAEEPASEPASEEPTPGVEGTVPPPEEGCGPNLVCAYAGAGFTGAIYAVECAQSGNFHPGPGYSSARNRCGSKKNKLYSGGIEVACMNPGEDRSNPGNFNNIWLPEVWGTTC
ncbi:MAG TPA: hypothetical protein VLK89_08645 [Solirubrobacterales bacterium]|nr:hypothetical protein [Solirubrobacterales bacterium]